MGIKALLILVFTFLIQMVSACPVCDKQQPIITRGLTHGVGPESNWDWLIITIIAVITLLTLVFSLKYLIHPGEKDPGHIKQSILSN